MWGHWFHRLVRCASDPVKRPDVEDWDLYHPPVPPMLECAGAASWYGAGVSARTRKGSTSESLAQETSAITTTESVETRIIDFFMAGSVVDAAGQFNRRTS